MEIIPAIDIIDGKCVRLIKGDYSQKKIYNNDPLEVARQFQDAGIKRLHLVDLDGARSGAIKNWKTLETIANNTKLKIDFGGGIKTEKDVELVLNSGAAFATVGSIAIKDENGFSAWLMKFGPDKFFLGADVKDEKIAINGWTETTEKNIDDFIETWLQKGIKQIFCTDINKDGMMEGPAFGLYRRLIQKFENLHLVASGGITAIADIDKLNETGCKGVIIGKALYEHRILLTDLNRFLS